jgi:hypothetical protein
MRMALLGRERDQLLRLLLNSLHIAHVLVKPGSFSHRIGDALRMTKDLRLGERLSNKRPCLIRISKGEKSGGHIAQTIYARVVRVNKRLRRMAP